MVMLDKPLLKKKMTLREKNELYYKTAYEYIGLSLAQERSIHLPFPVKSPVEPQVSSRKNFAYSNYVIYQISIYFRPSPRPHQLKLKRKRLKRRKTNSLRKTKKLSLR